MNLHFLEGFHPVLLALLGTVFTWFATALGAMVVFFFRKVNKLYLDGMLGIAAGIMIAACIWSLLEPAFEISKEKYGSLNWLPVTTGFILGAFVILIIDKILPHLHFESPIEKKEGVKTNWNKTTLLILAITLHNIPEGLAVGIAFASIADTSVFAQIVPALVLTLGIAIQDIPEGAAVSLPLRAMGMTRRRSFFWGQISGLVEVFGGILGVLAVMAMQSILPYALAFSAGAMMYVVVEELIPQSQAEGNTDIPTIGAILGFALMMILDNTL